MASFIEVHIVDRPEPTYLNVDYILNYVSGSIRDGSVSVPVTIIVLSSSGVHTNEVMYVDETIEQVSEMIRLAGNIIIGVRSGTAVTVA